MATDRQGHEGISRNRSCGCEYMFNKPVAKPCSKLLIQRYRVVLTGHSGRGPRTNSPMRSRLAAISLGYKQPKTRPRVGTKKPVRSRVNSLSLAVVQKLGPVSRAEQREIGFQSPPRTGHRQCCSEEGRGAVSDRQIAESQGLRPPSKPTMHKTERIWQPLER
jgi:hypothetical protein